MAKKATLPVELKKPKKEVAKYKTYEAFAKEYYENAVEVYDKTDFLDLHCNVSIWIENNVIKPSEYLLYKKRHCQEFTEEDIIYSFELLQKITNLYNGKTRYQPTIITFCRLLGISSRTLMNWSMQNNDRGEVICRVQDYFRSLLTQSMITGEVNPVSGAFIGKSTLGMKENDNGTTNINVFGADSVSVEDILSEYAKNYK